jgi:hypothetical protein
MTRVFAILALLACCAGAAAPASGAGRRIPYLWATVNICNTAAHSKEMGVRGSIPGDGERTRMYMRFAAEAYDRPTQAWVQMKRSAWVYVGVGIYKQRQSGYTFDLSTLPAGQPVTLRGVVDYRWTKHGRTIRTARQVTKGGHPNTADADPPSYSAALCDIS